MSEDKRDVLDVLRYELNFVEQGGYGNWYSTPWGPASIFQDSQSCLNHGDPTRSHACHECLLYDFVPEQFRTEDVPCHHIPLTGKGVTIATPQTEEELRENPEALAEADHRAHRSGTGEREGRRQVRRQVHHRGTEERERHESGCGMVNPCHPGSNRTACDAHPCFRRLRMV